MLPNGSLYLGTEPETWLHFAEFCEELRALGSAGLLTVALDCPHGAVWSALASRERFPPDLELTVRSRPWLHAPETPGGSGAT